MTISRNKVVPVSPPQYSPAEERINIATHALGFLLSIFALVALLLRANATNSILVLTSFGLFGISLVILYGVSTLYHSAKNPLLRSRLRIADHASIYLLIAGTYTPFALVVLQGSIGWFLFASSWLMALAGITLKLFYTGRFRLLSTLLYVFMGWIIVFAIGPLQESLDPQGLAWTLAGGIAYTLGALLYTIKRLPLNHAIFHLFVVMGSSCHFIAVYFYVR